MVDTVPEARLSVRRRIDRLLRDGRLTGEMLLSPVAVSRRVHPRHPVLGPWISMGVAMVVLTLGSVSVGQRAAVHMLEGLGSDGATVERVAAELRRLYAVAVALSPFSLGLGWCVAALGQWAVSVLAGRTVPFRLLLSIVAVASGPAVVEKMVDLSVTWHTGPEFGPDMRPIVAPATSVAALFPEGTGGAWGAALLDQVTLFGVWTVVLWVVGLRVRARLGRGAAVTIALAPWVALRLGAATMAVLSGSLAGSLGGAGG